MSLARERIAEIVNALPDDSSYDEILRELAFDRMIERGLADVETGRTVSHEEVKKQVRSWGE
ncbi:MAG: hypothetical protein HY706_01615 [Candidatus Hydrogenedentes bacterium]|nr:hypothetical protein [Candidatus Hydrogenedentota bacterium]